MRTSYEGLTESQADFLRKQMDGARNSKKNLRNKYIREGQNSRDEYIVWFKKRVAIDLLINEIQNIILQTAYTNSLRADVQEYGKQYKRTYAEACEDLGWKEPLEPRRPVW